MRNKLIFFAFIAATLMLITAVAISASDRPVNYDVASERMFEGTIAGKGHIVEGLMYFPLKTANTVVEVQIGPKEFVEHSALKVKPGNMVTVIGVMAVVNDRDVVLAREVSSMNGVLVVRDEMGVPLWETDKPIQMDPECPTRAALDLSSQTGDQD